VYAVRSHDAEGESELLRSGAGSQLTARGELGSRAELAVADYLAVRGFSIIGRNVRLGPLELDIVARKGPLVVVVEVRTRGPGSLQGPFESIDGIKQMRLRRAVARLWRDKLRAMSEVERVRIDVAAVRFEGRETWVEYIEGALA
jgi:putative endonuclease